MVRTSRASPTSGVFAVMANWFFPKVSLTEFDLSLVISSARRNACSSSSRGRAIRS